MPYDTALPIISSSSFHLAYLWLFIFSVLFSALTLLAVYLEHQAPKSWYQVAGDEYNFMASEESEQSRLDLAEAYIEIGQRTDAATILQGLLLSKNPITKQKAKQLLSLTPT